MLLPILFALVAPPNQQGPALDSLISRVEHGDTKARKALSAPAFQLARSADERRLTLEETRTVARAALALATPISDPEKPVTDNERTWRGPAVRALLRIRELDSTDVWSAERLEAIAPYPHLWKEPGQELQQLRVLAKQSGHLTAKLSFTLARLELECGSVDSAWRQFQTLPPNTATPAQRMHVEAEIRFARADTAGGAKAYYAGADAIANAEDVNAYAREMEWIADSTELVPWRALHGPQTGYRRWLEQFWTGRDLNDGQLPGTRLVEQFRRWRIGLANYRWLLDGSAAIGLPAPLEFATKLRSKQENIANRYRPLSRILDDRGGLLLRHGEPTVRVNLPGLDATDFATWSWATPQGPLIVGFSRPESIDHVTIVRFGMISRNLPMGDLMTVCQLEAGMCRLRGGNNVGGTLVRLLVRKYTAMRELAEHTDGNAPNYKKDLGTVFQVYGIPGGGALVVMGVPAHTLASAGPKDATEPLAAHLRVLVGDSAAGRIVTTLDTVRRWTRPSGEGAWLTGYVTVPAPVGNWGVSIIASDTAQLVGSGQRFGGVPVVPFDGRKLDLSDPILGREAAGLVWRHDGQEIPLNPTNAWYPDEAAILSFAIDGMVSGHSYQTRFDIWKSSGHPSSPSVSVSYTTQANAPRMTVRRDLTLKNLEPANYRVVVTVIDVQTKGSVSRERLLAVRKR